MADVKVYQSNQRMPHHPQGDQKLLQLGTLIKIDPQKVQKKSSATTKSENA